MVRHLLSSVVARAVAASVVGCALLVLPVRARAQEPSAAVTTLGQGFGGQGQLVISGDPGKLNAEFTKVNHGGWVLGIRPAADYFVLPGISIGVVLGFAIGDNSAKGFEAGGRVGYNLNVTEHVGAWPTAGISYTKVTGTGGFNSTYGNLFVPLLYHVIPHVFVGIGPFYNLNIAGAGEHSYGFHSTV